ncbi:MAG: type II toxin-antitoxin system HicB family antitoxin [Waterburya sp.]
MNKKPRNYDWDGFTINLYLDDEQDWIAHLVELPNVSAHGDTADEALEELYVAWEMVKEDYQEDGEEIPIAPSRKDYSGCFNVRIDKRVHRALAIEAAQAGISLNALVSAKLAGK